jgi:serine/threonine protein kinase
MSEGSRRPPFEVPKVEMGQYLGGGSFGAVYKGRHTTLDVDVAVKFIDSTAGDLAAVEQALAEGKLMARLDHPNLLRIHDAGRAGAMIYLVLELMDDSCVGLRNLPADRALDLSRQLLSGLQALHDARVLHRDIKPANCLLRTRDGRVKLADLGIAVQQSTQTEKIYDTAGTIAYMAPELFESPPKFGSRSDLYALGMTLACMLLGSDPFPSSFSELIAWVQNGPRPRLSIARPDLPHLLTTLVERMISLRPHERPASAAEALATLAQIVSLPSVTTPEQPETQMMIGPWVVGAQLFASPNWSMYVVTHAYTGMAARLAHAQPRGSLTRSSELILASAERASRLDHPGILDIIDWGTLDGYAYVVSAPRGRELAAFVESAGPCTEIQAVEFGSAIADALAYLHGYKLVYQIVEPSSVVITPDARSVQLGWPMFCVPAGTPVRDKGKPQRVMVEQYTAPEAVSLGYDTIEPSVDIYGLGTVIYYLLAGGRHAVGDAVSGALTGALPTDVRAYAPAVTAPTATLVAQMMNPDPALRPAAAEVRDRLNRILRRLRGVGGDRNPSQPPVSDLERTVTI